MKTLLLLLLPAVLGNNAVKWCRVNERILGGERADKSEFPGLLPVPMSTIDPRSKITPIPEQDQNLTSNEVTLVGWGATSTTWMSPYLNKLEHVPLSQELCLKVGVSPDKALCRYPTHATGTACSFDDGGPIFMDGLQVGIVSEVPLFSSGLIPIDTRVSGYRDWIDENIRSHTS
ncbi:chymotrypsin-1 isoform X2 [Anabrus simplex]|uniref:chymotrypsin-1 isoform X2 n=1 Tax=Anabrus simplex TaxID=316456 RepID=UPI0035A3197B